jgi:FtsZ-binding cell division protein ZapB
MSNLNHNEFRKLCEGLKEEQLLLEVPEDDEVAILTEAVPKMLGRLERRGARIVQLQKERDEARADAKRLRAENSLFRKQQNRHLDVLSPLFQCGGKYARLGELGGYLVDSVPRAINLLERKLDEARAERDHAIELYDEMMGKRNKAEAEVEHKNMMLQQAGETITRHKGEVERLREYAATVTHELKCSRPDFGREIDERYQREVTP